MPKESGGRRPNKTQRREIAKQRRLEEIRRRARHEQMARVRKGLLALLVVGVVASVIVNSQLRGKASRERLNRLAAAAGCSALQHPPDQGNSPHLQAGENFNYNSNPPTSGHHDASTANTGISDQPIPDRNQVHNLEHGHVGIQYKDIDDSLERALEGVTRSNDTRIFMAPRPELDVELALTSWDNVVRCQTPNAKAADLAREFARQLTGKGPEGDLPGRPG